MRHLTGMTIGLIGCFLMAPSLAEAGSDAQMLPPLQYNTSTGTAAACDTSLPANTTHVLFYNSAAVASGLTSGNSAINCDSRFTYNASTGQVIVSTTSGGGLGSGSGLGTGLGLGSSSTSSTTINSGSVVVAASGGPLTSASSTLSPGNLILSSAGSGDPFILTSAGLNNDFFKLDATGLTLSTRTPVLTQTVSITSSNGSASFGQGLYTFGVSPNIMTVGQPKNNANLVVNGNAQVSSLAGCLGPVEADSAGNLTCGTFPAASAAPTSPVPSCTTNGQTLTWNASTGQFVCSGTPGGSLLYTHQIRLAGATAWNNALLSAMVFQGIADPRITSLGAGLVASALTHPAIDYWNLCQLMTTGADGSGSTPPTLSYPADVSTPEATQFITATSNTSTTCYEMACEGVLGFYASQTHIAGLCAPGATPTNTGNSACDSPGNTISDPNTTAAADSAGGVPLIVVDCLSSK